MPDAQGSGAAGVAPPAVEPPGLAAAGQHVGHHRFERGRCQPQGLKAGEFAAVQADPERAEGMDVALRTLAGLPFGAVLLCLIALGFAGYGVYAFARARFAKV